MSNYKRICTVPGCGELVGEWWFAYHNGPCLYHSRTATPKPAKPGTSFVTYLRLVWTHFVFLLGCFQLGRLVGEAIKYLFLGGCCQ